jgi:hypothetical protein
MDEYIFSAIRKSKRCKVEKEKENKMDELFF